MPVKNQQFGIEQIDQAGGGNAQVMPRPANDLAGQTIALAGRLADRPHSRRRRQGMDHCRKRRPSSIAPRRGHLGDNGFCRGDRLQATAFAARTKVPLGHCPVVADFARHAVRPRSTCPLRIATAPTPASTSKQTALLHPLPTPCRYSPKTMAMPALLTTAGTCKAFSSRSFAGAASPSSPAVRDAPGGDRRRPRSPVRRRGACPASPPRL